MSRFPALPLRHVALVCSILVAGLAASVLPAEQTGGGPERWGRSGVNAPELSEEGDWYGTWYYVSRVRKMALWIRDDNGQIQVRLRLQGQKGDPESFTTDWDGQAEYHLAGRHGRFSMSFESMDENEIRGSWIWDVQTASAGRTETAEFTIHRLGWGRQLVFKIQNVQHDYRGDAEPIPSVAEFLWLFRKASRRQALWSELPF